MQDACFGRLQSERCVTKGAAPRHQWPHTRPMAPQTTAGYYANGGSNWWLHQHASFWRLRWVVRAGLPRASHGRLACQGRSTAPCWGCPAVALHPKALIPYAVPTRTHALQVGPPTLLVLLPKALGAKSQSGTNPADYTCVAPWGYDPSNPNDPSILGNDCGGDWGLFPSQKSCHDAINDGLDTLDPAIFK